ncbi:ras guanine nucleotide exchange factor domain-containing protein [Dichotomocladium elegans]|nr:ras guanine nucleotide exchange factor domain-containing protein [Dichotomocladium elegans]
MSKVRILCRVQARFPFNSNDPSSLSFEQGDIIEVLTKLDSGWWDGWCDGARGWFPSNYVQVIDNYDETSSNPDLEINDTRLYGENIAPYIPISDESDVTKPRTKNGVPLRTNNEYRLSLPYQGIDPLLDAADIEKSMALDASGQQKSTLPPNWSLQMTEDGTECYFYNHITGEMRNSHPEDVSESEIDDIGSYGGNASMDGDNDGSYDFESVGSQTWEDHHNMTDDMPIPAPWVRRVDDQGRIYYLNTITDQTVSDYHQLMLNKGIKSSPEKYWHDDIPIPSAPPKPLPRSPSRQTSVRRTSVIDSSEPLTWSKISAHIALAIHNLNAAAKSGQKALLVSYAAAIVNAVRMMLITSGTIDKESVHIKTNAVLRAHHRAMMASMSKLVLSSQLSADSINENVSKMLSDSNELLLAVRNFVTTCQDIPVTVNHMDPILLDSKDPLVQAGIVREDIRNVQRVKYTLQHDLSDNLEAYGNSMYESIDVILASIRRDGNLDESRFSLAALLFTQFRNLANQTAQFLGIIEDTDYSGFESSPHVFRLNANKQQLSDSLGALFCWMQNMTDESMSLENVISEMETAASSISEPIRNICTCIAKLVNEVPPNAPGSAAGIGVPDATPSSPMTALSRSANLAESIIHEEDEEQLMKDSPIAQSFVTADPAIALADASTGDQEKILRMPSTGPNSPTTGTTSSDTSISSSMQSRSESLSLRRLSTASSTTRNKSTKKLHKFFGDDAQAAVAAASKPTANERPWFLQYDYGPTEIVFNMEGYVKGGTLPGLVERLTLHDYLDMNFNNTFLLTYRSFCTSMELLNLLEARYNLTPPQGLTDEELETWTQKKLKLVRLRVFNVLKNWLELYYNEDDHIILDPLEEFTNSSIRSTMSFSADQLERLIRMRKEDQLQGGLKKMILTLPDPPEPILPRNRKKFKLMDIDTLEIARQLTIMDFKLYSSIRPIECLDKAWSKDPNDDNGKVAVNIRSSIEYCNEVTSWVSDAILSQSDIKKRSSVIKYWVQVAEKCRSLNNFNTCMAILSAFDNSSVGRLKRTWEMVGARTNQTLSQIRKLMGANRNFTEYRAIIHSINPPCIPFLGIYLQDLTFIEDGNPNYLKKSKELINFAKRAKAAEVIREIQQYQSSLYRLKPVEELQMFIQANLQSTRDEEQLYNESLKLEPREREDEKITRLLQESGFL